MARGGRLDRSKRIPYHNPALKLAYLNSDGLTLDKLTAIEQNFKKHNQNILGISEIGKYWNEQLPGRGWISSLTPETNAEGIGILLDMETQKSVIEVIKTSNRILGLVLKTHKGKVLIVATYAPQEGLPNEKYIKL